MNEKPKVDFKTTIKLVKKSGGMNLLYACLVTAGLTVVFNLLHLMLVQYEVILLMLSAPFALATLVLFYIVFFRYMRAFDEYKKDLMSGRAHKWSDDAD